MRRLGAGAFLAVSQGNRRRAMRASCTCRIGRAAPRAPAVSLVGKGICFDTGGTNLKTHKSMLDMHTDMEGSAVAVGSLYALHSLRSPLAVDCWLAITENRIGPRAYKPQDVVRAHNGTTIQVIHTDAEGRMVLADALSLAARDKPRAIIDYATLTGACVLCAHGALQRCVHQSAGGARAHRSGRRQQRRTRLVFPDGQGLRHGPRKHASPTCCSARPSPRAITFWRRAFLNRFVPEDDPLAAPGPRRRLAPRRPRAHRHRDHRVRRALHARSAAPWLARCGGGSMKLHGRA